MKKTVNFLAWSIALTLVFYFLADRLLPPPPPSTQMILLFAGIAVIVVWIVQCILSFRHKNSFSKKG